METITLKVEGMSCDHCVRAVKGALEGVDGVGQAQVELDRGEAVVSLDTARTDVAKLSAAVDEAGYKAVAV